MTIRKSEISFRAKKRAIAFTAILSIILGIWGLQSAVKADGFLWTSGGEVEYSVDENQDQIDNHQECTTQQIYVDKIPNRKYIDNSDTVQSCVYDQGSFRYGVYNRKYKAGLGSPKTETEFVIGIGNDTKMYRVVGHSIVKLPDFIPESNSSVYSVNNSSSSYGDELKIYRNNLERLIKNADNTYSIDENLEPDFILKRPDGYVLPVGGVASSSNGRWLALEVAHFGIVRVDMDTYAIKRVSNRAPSHGVGSNPVTKLAITDDGQYIATGGKNTPYYVYRATDECGDATITNEMTSSTPVANPCEEVSLTNILNENYSGLQQTEYLRFSPDGGELSFLVMQSGASNPLWVTLKAPGYTAPIRLDYLALGDSFASGEGDIHWENGNRINHYLSGTDIAGDYSQGIPREKCHISSRSYPFSLAGATQLDSSLTKSVACSGAKRIDVQGYDVQRGTNIYEGQEVNVGGVKRPRLTGLANINMLQFDAKESFIPGRVQQIEFMEQNQPEVATISMGGNDIGFGDIITACVSKIVPTSTCSQSEDEGRAILGKAIRGQFTNLRDMYVRLKEASPEVKLYVVGYPQFISNTNSTCMLNVPLSISERTMMVEGVIYLNNIIKAAAAEARVGYIDIENSFGEHVLCGLESEKYVNGILSMGESQEMFHPNAAGHVAIHQTIVGGLNGQSLADNVCNAVIVCPDPQNAVLPSVPDYFAEPVSGYDWIATQAQSLREVAEGAVEVVTNTIEQAAEAAVKLSPTSFQPMSTVIIELHSDPVGLGEFTVEDDGGLNADVLIPEDIPAGYHTLHVYGYSYSGEPIDYYQIIQVEEKS